MIVAIDNKNGISKNGVIPWDFPEDRNFFMDVTKREYVKGLKNVLIMGKNTWLQCKDKIKDRIIIVVSTTLSDDVFVVPTFKLALEKASSLPIGHIFICGGASLYHEAFNEVNTIYLTLINHDYECDNKINLDFSRYQTYSSLTVDKLTFKKLYFTFPNYWIETEEHQYLNLLKDILTTGHFRPTRNAKTWSLFGKTLTFDLNRGFPLLSTKTVFFRGAVEEILFILKGQTNAKILADKGINYWNANTSREFLDSVGLPHFKEFTMGEIYGYNLRHFGHPYDTCDSDYTNQGFDQVQYVLNLLKTDPFSRRIIMTTFNPSTTHNACLMGCHSIVLQFYVDQDFRLNLSCYNRSQDYMLGNPINIAMSALLVSMFCEVLNNTTTNTFTPGQLIINMGDVHIYEDHKLAAMRQLLRDPFPFPTLNINRQVTDLTDFKFEDFELINYQHYPTIAAKMTA